MWSQGDSFNVVQQRNLACAAVILITTVSSQFQPMPLLKRAAPFDDPEYN